jgi:tRNA (guanine-N1)-methyltransferase
MGPDEIMWDIAAAPWTARVLTIFPEMFPGPLAASLAGQALAAGKWRMETVDIRTFARDKHASVDDSPFGGGPGMVMRPDVIDAAIDAAIASGPMPLIYLTPRGRVLDQARVRSLADGPGAVLLCGRYEGIDERVIEARRPEEISLGDFVLSGGEPAAIALIDACVRLLPGVIGDARSLAEESFEHGLLEYPHYTRPREWQGRPVPEVLTEGHHARICAWRKAEAERLTQERRPDLWRRLGTGGSVRRAAGSPAECRSGGDAALTEDEGNRR